MNATRFLFWVLCTVLCVLSPVLEALMNYFELAAHAASILTGIAYLVKDILWLRLLIVLACVAGIVFNYAVPRPRLWVVI